jgi:hypothetical protein
MMSIWAKLLTGRGALFREALRDPEEWRPN